MTAVARMAKAQRCRCGSGVFSANQRTAVVCLSVVVVCYAFLCSPQSSSAYLLTIHLIWCFICLGLQALAQQVLARGKDIAVPTAASQRRIHALLTLMLLRCLRAGAGAAGPGSWQGHCCA
jgi:hypothetical protein